MLWNEAFVVEFNSVNKVSDSAFAMNSKSYTHRHNRQTSTYSLHIRLYFSFSLSLCHCENATLGEYIQAFRFLIARNLDKMTTVRWAVFLFIHSVLLILSIAVCAFGFCVCIANRLHYAFAPRQMATTTTTAAASQPFSTSNHRMFASESHLTNTHTHSFRSHTEIMGFVELSFFICCSYFINVPLHFTAAAFWFIPNKSHLLLNLLYSTLFAKVIFLSPQSCLALLSPLHKRIDWGTRDAKEKHARQMQPKSTHTHQTISIDVRILIMGLRCQWRMRRKIVDRHRRWSEFTLNSVRLSYFNYLGVICDFRVTENGEREREKKTKKMRETENVDFLWKFPSI